MNNLTGKTPLAIACHQLGSVEFLRSGAYVNLNDIAKPFGKRLDNWMRLKSTKELLAEFQRDHAYRGKKGVIAVMGRNLDPSDLRYLNLLGVTEPKQGTWGHPDIAIQFAQWCSPAFALWVSRQIRHLMTYGEVNIHYTEWGGYYLQGLEYNREDVRDLYGR